MSAMTTAETLPTTLAVPRPRIFTAPLILLSLAGFGAMASFYLLLSVVPMYATAIGVGGVGAGFATGALMLSTVAAEFGTPRLVTRFGHRAVLAAGLLLLGAPALALPGSASVAMMMAVCVVRGLGFAIIVVVGGALVASLVPAERRGEGLGLYGVVVGVPGVAGLPLGVWLAGEIGYSPVFVAGGLAALAGLAAVPGLPGREPAPEQPLGMLAGLRTPALVRPAIIFSGTAIAGGVVVTFVPVAVPQASGGLAAVALLVQAAAATLSRWWAGRYGDRHGGSALLVPGVLLAATGMLSLVLMASPAALLVGMVLFGAGFGIAQNVTLSLMFARVPASGYGTASALWNLAYDSGYGLGAAGFGVLAVQTGYPAAFALTGVLVLAALALARRDR